MASHDEQTAIVSARNMLPLLNALMDEECQWVERRSKKTHNDDFGVPIPAYAQYFFRRAGVSFSDVRRLSVESMCSLGSCLFDGNPHLRVLAEKKNDLRLSDKLSAVTKYREQPVPATEEKP